MSRFLQRAGNPQEDMLNKSKEDSLNYIQLKLQKLLETLAENNEHFAGRLIGVGSYFEGVPFSGEELDFVYELESYIAGKHPEILLLQEKNVNTFKPRENRDIYPAIYFKIKIGDKYLEARCLQEQFKELLIENIVKSSTDCDTCPNEPIIMSRGPAVVLFFDYFNDRNCSNRSPGNIKLDITLSIPIKTGDMLLSEWFAAQSPPIDVPLNQLYQDSMRSAHLVPSGDFWKLSFSVKERDLVKEAMMESGKKTCYSAIKVSLF